MRAKYVHTNLIATNWRKLADFYCRVFGCYLVPPERDYRGDDLDRGTGLTKAHLYGAHLRLPGYGEDGPTLEIYSYEPLAPSQPVAVNQPGFGHIAFEVDDVTQAYETVIANGGQTVGEIVTLTTSAGRHVTFCYVRDPEGNILELQSWA